jgi:hypothetical protein
MKYKKEEIFQMLGPGVTNEQVLYIFYKCNGDEENAKIYLELCIERIEELKVKADNMMTTEELEELKKLVKME